MSTKVMKGEFQTNIGCVDSFIRIFIGLLFLSGALIGTIGMWGLAGGILIVNGLSRFSFVYKFLNINTNRCDPESSR
jgi:hypothetical protein